MTLPPIIYLVQEMKINYEEGKIMKKILKYIVAIAIVIIGIFMLGMISGDNETGNPAGIAALYLILSGIFFYHYFRNRNISNL